jgi:hypothetical protein
MALTDKELIELAKEELNNDDNDRHDIKYFQEVHNLSDGDDEVVLTHLYHYYKKWSIDPVSKGVFLEMLSLANKNENFVGVNKSNCNIDFDKVLGEYVKKERSVQKEERFRKVSSFKSKT